MKKQLLSFDPTTDDEDLDNPIDYISELENKQRLQDINNLRLLSVCKECIVGINAIDIVSGKNKLSIGISEFDLFDLFPIITGSSSSSSSSSSIPSGKQQHGKKVQPSSKSSEKSETMEEIFKRTNITRKK
jgi:hypothetical protein